MAVPRPWNPQDAPRPWNSTHLGAYGRGTANVRRQGYTAILAAQAAYTLSLWGRHILHVDE